MPNPDQDFKVADLSLAPWGRKEIELAEVEMPGLMALRAEFGDTKPLTGARITGSLHMTIQTGGAHRDADRPRRRRALGQLQHLLHPGPRRRRRRGRPRRHGGQPLRRARLRLEGRDARGLLVVHRAAVQVLRRPGPEHDPRRRWRRHPARAQGPRVREGRRRARCHRRRPRGVGRHPRHAEALAGRGPQPVDHHRQRASRASARRPPPASTASTRCSSAASCCSRPSTSTTRSPSRSSTTCTAAATASSTASTAASTSCSAARSPSSAATATSARAARSPCGARALA